MKASVWGVYHGQRQPCSALADGEMEEPTWVLLSLYYLYRVMCFSALFFGVISFDTFLLCYVVL